MKLPGHALTLLLLVNGTTARSQAPPPDPPEVLRQVGDQIIQELLDPRFDQDHPTVLLLGASQIKLGQAEAGRQTLRRASELAILERHPDMASSPIPALAANAAMQLEFDDPEGATASVRKALRDIDRADPLEYFRYLRDMGKVLWRCKAKEEADGLHQKVQAAFDHLKEDGKQQVEAHMAGYLAIIGRLDEAFALLDAVSATTEDQVRLARSGQILLELVRAASYGEGRRRVTDPAEQASERRELAELRPRLERAGAIPLRDDILGALVWRYARIGDFDEADRILQPIPDVPDDNPRFRTRSDGYMVLLTQISLWQFQAGQAEPARARLRTALARTQARKSLPYRLAGLKSLATAMGQVDDPDGMALCIEAFGPGERSETLIELARLQRRLGNAAAEREAIQKALDDARERVEHPPATLVSRLYPEPTAPLTEAHRKNQQVYEHYVSLERLALAQIASGDFEAARATALQVTPDSLKKLAVTHIARGLAEAGQARATLDWLHSLGYPGSDPQPLFLGALQGITSRLAELEPAARLPREATGP